MLEKILSKNNILASNIEYLSEGWSNVIYHGSSQESKKRDLIIKQMKDSIPEYNQKNIHHFLLQAMDNESTILRQLNHKSIPKLLNDFVFENRRYLILEKKQGITLYEFVKKQEVNWLVIKRIFIGLVSIVSYLHSQKIVHADINPNNIIVSCSDAEGFNVDLIDFGASQFVYKPPVWNYPLGRHTFMAPEVLLERNCIPPYESFGFGVDIHQLACLIFFMVNKKDPFRRPYAHEDYTTDFLDKVGYFMNEHIDKKIEYFFKPNIMPKNFLNIYKKMLDPNPEHRYCDIMELKTDFMEI